jgi:hypothetical protein
MCILKTPSVSSRHHHYGERRIDLRIDQVKAQVQDKQLEDIICLKLAIYCLHGYVKICLKRVSPIDKGIDNRAHQLSTPKARLARPNCNTSQNTSSCRMSIL